MLTEIKIEKSADYDLKSPKSEISEKKFKTEITKHIQNLKCNEGDDIVLEIYLNRSIKDNDIIEWKKNGEFLVNSIGTNINRYNDNLLSNFSLTSNNEKSTLVIKNSHKKDGGQYEISLIELDNLTEQPKEPILVKSKCNVNVISYIEKSEILKQLPRVLKLNEGDNMRLDCILDKQPAKVAWYHNSIELIPEQKEQSKIEITSLDEGKMQILEVNNIKLQKHDGTYQMHADDKI